MSGVGVGSPLENRIVARITKTATTRARTAALRTSYMLARLGLLFQQLVERSLHVRDMRQAFCGPFRFSLPLRFRRAFDHSVILERGGSAGGRTRRTGLVSRVQGGPVYQFQHGATKVTSAPDVGAGGVSNLKPAPASLGPSSAALNLSSRHHPAFVVSSGDGCANALRQRARLREVSQARPTAIHDVASIQNCAGCESIAAASGVTEIGDGWSTRQSSTPICRLATLSSSTGQPVSSPGPSSRSKRRP